MIKQLAVFSSLALAAATAHAATAPVVAYVYSQNSTGITVYTAASTGKLTLVKGSPFQPTDEAVGSHGTYTTNYGAVGTNGKFWVSYVVDTYDQQQTTSHLVSFAILTNGAIGKKVSAINTQVYSGAQCQTYQISTYSATFDHTGQYVYASFGGGSNGGGGCAAVQTYQISKSGELTFKGATVFDGTSYNQDPEFNGGLPKGTGDNKFAFSMAPTLNSYYPQLQTFSRETSGTLNWQQSLETDPVSPTKYPFTPTGVFSNDPTNHLAVALTQAYSPDTAGLVVQLASYTVGPNGEVSSTNTYESMPTVPDYAYCLKLDPSGKMLAICTGNGVQVFHFNGASPITPFTDIIGTSGSVPTVAWDNSGHLYAINSLSNRLHVYTLTSNGIEEAAGSPYSGPPSYFNLIVRAK